MIKSKLLEIKPSRLLGDFNQKEHLRKKSPPNFSKIGSSDSEGSKIISYKNFWDSRTFGSTRKKLNKVEHGGA